jgi:hypothetical protein
MRPKLDSNAFAKCPICGLKVSWDRLYLRCANIQCIMISFSPVDRFVSEILLGSDDKLSQLWFSSENGEITYWRNGGTNKQAFPDSDIPRPENLVDAKYIRVLNEFFEDRARLELFL